MDEDIGENSVVQVNELGPKEWRGCFVQVKEVTGFEASGWAMVPFQGRVYMSFKANQICYIGEAIFVPDGK